MGRSRLRASGLLTRGTTVALTALLLWRLMLEGVMAEVLRRPGVSGGRAAARPRPSSTPRDPALGVAAGAIVMLSYALLVSGAATLLYARRDPA